MQAKPISPELLEQILSPGVQIRFWSKVSILGPNDCWLWKASRCGKDGYGQFGMRHNGRNTFIKSHKFAWISSNKTDVPNGLYVLHSCIATKACCNPSHLRPGTHEENMLDMFNQGRSTGAKGAQNHLTKFSVEDVLKMRAEFAKGSNYSAAARAFNMTPANARSIILRETWKHI